MDKNKELVEKECGWCGRNSYVDKDEKTCPSCNKEGFYSQESPCK